MNEQLSEFSEENLRKLLDSNADSIIVLDSDGVILYFNVAASDLFANKFEVGDEFGFPVAAGEVAEVEVLHRHGERVVAEMRVVEIQWHGQAAYLASLRDVTQRTINAETLKALVDERTRELQEANKKLEALYHDAAKASKLRSQFIANFSHEVRTPLSGILASAELLLIPDQEDREVLTQLIFDSAKQFMLLLDTILDFSKLESGHRTIEKDFFSFPDLLNLVIDSCRISATANGTKLVSNLSEDIPDEILADAGKVRQVILNLVSNAIKFTNNGEIRVDATVCDVRDRQFVKVTVKDSGIGIDSSVGEDVFKPFVQANSGIFKGFGGTGLGLAISKELVTLMEGEINFESSPGKGTTFWFTFPLEVRQ